MNPKLRNLKINFVYSITPMGKKLLPGDLKKREVQIPVDEIELPLIKSWIMDHPDTDLTSLKGFMNQLTRLRRD